MKEARIIKTRLIWPGRSGWTFRNWIFIKPGLSKAREARLIAHEKVHVDQYREEGTARFLAKYFAEYLVNLIKYKNHHRAYREISYEIEARQVSAKD